MDMIENLDEFTTKDYSLQCLSADISNLPTDAAPGSTCFVVDTAELYQFASGQWRRVGG